MFSWIKRKPVAEEARPEYWVSPYGDEQPSPRGAPTYAGERPNFVERAKQRVVESSFGRSPGEEITRGTEEVQLNLAEVQAAKAKEESQKRIKEQEEEGLRRKAKETWEEVAREPMSELVRTYGEKGAKRHLEVEKRESSLKEELAAYGINPEDLPTRQEYIGPKDRQGRPLTNEHAADPRNWLTVRQSMTEALTAARKAEWEATKEKYRPITEMARPTARAGVSAMGEISKGLAIGAQRGGAPGRGGPARAARMHTPQASGVSSSLFDISGMKRAGSPTMPASMLTGKGLEGMRMPLQITSAERQIPGLSRDESLILTVLKKEGNKTREELAAITGLSTVQVDRILSRLRKNGHLQKPKPRTRVGPVVGKLTSRLF